MENAVGDFGALGFWLFIAAIVVADYWDSARKRESQHQTLRKMIESGQTVDPVLLDKLLDNDKASRSDRGLWVWGLVTLSSSVGLVVLSFVVSSPSDDSLHPLVGVAGLVACIGVGLLISSKVVAKWMRQDAETSADLP